MPTRLDRFHIFANGNIVTNKYASAFEAEGIRLAQNARIYGSSTTGGVSLSKQLALNTRNGVVVAEARQKISARQIAKGVAALGASVAGGWAGVALIGVPLILDLLDDAGLQVQPDGTLLQQVSTGEFRYNITPTPPWVRDYLAGCKQITSSYTSARFNSFPNPTTIRIDCRIGTGSWVPQNFTYRTVSETQVPTPQAIEDALTNANPSPGVLKELGDNGITPDPDPADPGQVLNPQPSQEKTTTKTNPDGSTETTVCQTTGAVVGNSVKLTESCTTTARDPSGNVTSTTTTTTDDADPEPGQQEQSLFCELFPKVLACAEFGEPEGDEIPTEERSVDFEPELLFGNGSCPADTSITVNGTTITIGQWSSWCPYLTDYVRPMVLLLSAFMALMIVARGMPE